MQLSPAVAKDSPEQNYPQKRSECPWLGIRISESPEPGQRTFTTLSSVSCPFISTLSPEGCSSSLEIGTDDYASEPQQEPCPYACVISLGDDSETDTEGDSEPCSAREQECEVSGKSVLKSLTTVNWADYVCSFWECDLAQGGRRKPILS